MKSRKSLKEDLEDYIKNKNKQITESDYILLKVRWMHDPNKRTALKLIDDLNGCEVTYTDYDFVIATMMKSPIHKILMKHRTQLPSQYKEQRSKTTHAHLIAVRKGTEEAQEYKAHTL